MGIVLRVILLVVLINGTETKKDVIFEKSENVEIFENVVNVGILEAFFEKTEKVEVFEKVEIFGELEKIEVFETVFEVFEKVEIFENIVDVEKRLSEDSIKGVVQQGPLEIRVGAKEIFIIVIFNKTCEDTFEEVFENKLFENNLKMSDHRYIHLGTRLQIREICHFKTNLYQWDW